jgi:hypothetical protein
MKPIKLGVLIRLGEQDRFLVDAKPGWSIHGARRILLNIKDFLSKLKLLKFPVTLQAAADLIAFTNELEKTPANATLTAAQAERLMRIMDKLRSTLDAEAQIQVAYVLTEKRFDVGKLVVDPESFLAKATFDKLPRLAQFDLKEAGKCIAFELPTAAAFHLLRATEDTLRSYQKVFVKREKSDKVTWGDLLQSLRTKKRKPKPDEILLNHLDHIRKNFRNPTDHPEMVHDLDGVQDLFSIVLDVLNRMAKELPSQKPNLLPIPAATSGPGSGEAETPESPVAKPTP